jgi:plasmid stabilization system protein ParE
MFTIKFKPEVYEDIKTAYDWYESQKIGLGEDFILMLEESYENIAKTPKIYQLIHKTVRRKLIKKFPYGIFFTIKDNNVIILAIMHTRRKPIKWHKRT